MIIYDEAGRKTLSEHWAFEEPLNELLEKLSMSFWRSFDLALTRFVWAFEVAFDELLKKPSISFWRSFYPAFTNLLKKLWLSFWRIQWAFEEAFNAHFKSLLWAFVFELSKLFSKFSSISNGQMGFFYKIAHKFIS